MQTEQELSPELAKQEKLVFWGYLIQWSFWIFLPSIAISLIYLLIIRGRVTNTALRSHIKWQLATLGLILAMIPIALLFVFIGLSGINTDAPVSIAATFIVIGASFLFLPWLLYRLLYGTIKFSKQTPMPRVFV